MTRARRRIAFAWLLDGLATVAEITGAVFGDGHHVAFAVSAKATAVLAQWAATAVRDQR